jgi:hypothetical protein
MEDDTPGDFNGILHLPSKRKAGRKTEHTMLHDLAIHFQARETLRFRSHCPPT